MATEEHVSDRLATVGTPLAEGVPVQISYELIRLLSEQLYSSPAKAIEELVVNAWDADARRCRVRLPGDGDASGSIVVFDDGHGMDQNGLRDLWLVGASRKRESDRPVHTERQQIGKFGIGKLATYAVADRITYITRTGETILSVTVDFTAFSKSEDVGAVVEPVVVEVLELERSNLQDEERFTLLSAAVEQEARELCADGPASWTFVVLEDLKPAAASLTVGRLTWVFRTAMPLDRDFELTLNGVPIAGADEDADWLVDFAVVDLPPSRLQSLSETTDQQWSVVEDALVCDALPSGVTGRVRVAKESLYRPTTKRADLGRSHGFFVRVRNRLVNEEDPLFGLRPRSYQVFNRFIAQIEADDLDANLTAPRETVERSDTKVVFEALLSELFSQARAVYEEASNERREAERRKKEQDRSFVPSILVEQPIADVVVAAEVADDDSWTLVDIGEDPEKIDALIAELYSDTDKRRGYRYSYEERGDDQLVLFDPDDRLFVINEQHPLVEEFGDEEGGRTRELIELVATSEAMLEVYLREAGVEPPRVRQIIDKHDQLLRSLAQERAHSPAALAKAIRASQYHDKELEASLVTAMRLLGFSSEHVSGSGTPDGTAEFYDGERTVKLTLEAKASGTGSAIELPQLGFDGLRSHADAEKADGCLLVAPAYPGDPSTGEAARRARSNRISCWTVEQLAQVVEATQRRHLTTKDLLDIVLLRHDPAAVTDSIDRLLTEPGWSELDLRSAVLDTAIELSRRVAGEPPDERAILLTISGGSMFQGLTRDAVHDALETLARGSAGGLFVAADRKVYLRVGADELRRRTAGLVAQQATPLRSGPFLQVPKGPAGRS